MYDDEYGSNETLTLTWHANEGPASNFSTVFIIDSRKYGAKSWRTLAKVRKMAKINSFQECRIFHFFHFLLF